MGSHLKLLNGIVMLCMDILQSRRKILDTTSFIFTWVLSFSNYFTNEIICAIRNFFTLQFSLFVGRAILRSYSLISIMEKWNFL